MWKVFRELTRRGTDFASSVGGFLGPSVGHQYVQPVGSKNDAATDLLIFSVHEVKQPIFGIYVKRSLLVVTLYD